MIKFRIDVGWHIGETWKLLYVCVLEVAERYATILEIGALKFSVSISVEW